VVGSRSVQDVSWHLVKHSGYIEVLSTARKVDFIPNTMHIRPRRK
jgi:hypothetical protein